MKKIIKSRLFLVIITMIVCISGTLYAANKYQASEVVYNKKDGTSTNVNDALNELYSKVGNKGYYYYYVNGIVIYYNPVSGKKCEASEAVSTTGTKTGCMKWYIFNDDSESSTVNMILDHNTTATLTWHSSDENVTYEESNIKPEIDKLVSESKWKDNPRLINTEEIIQITENINWTNAIAWYYFDSNNQTRTSTSQGESKYFWLFDYTNGCTSYGCNIENLNTYGYWTSPTLGTDGSVSNVWFVYRGGYLHRRYASITGIGIRPVITISKSIIK